MATPLYRSVHAMNSNDTSITDFHTNWEKAVFSAYNDNGIIKEMGILFDAINPLPYTVRLDNGLGFHQGYSQVWGAMSKRSNIHWMKKADLVICLSFCHGYIRRAKALLAANGMEA